MGNKIGYRSDIDGLRAIAILSVLIFHLNPKYLSGGFVGVDIFFVISGFLITSLIKKEIEETASFSFKNFYIRRVKRLLPALFFSLILTTIFATLILSPTHLSSFGLSQISSIFSVSNFYFWIESDYFDVESKLKPLLHTWSLSVEEQFYFIWPLTLILLLKVRRKIFIYSFLIFLVLFSLYLNLKFQDGNIHIINKYFTDWKEYFENGKSTLFFMLPFRTYEFILGASLVWILNYKINIKYFYDVLFIIGLILIGYSMFYLDENIIFPSYYGFIPTIGATIIIYTGNKTRLNFILSNKFMVGIGLISYSLYLFHWPIIVFWNYINPTPLLVDNAIISLISLFLAYLSYKFVEQPFRINKFINYSFISKIFIFGLPIALVLISWSMYINNGWKWRISSPVVFENVGDSKDFHKKFYGGAGYSRTGINTNQPADIVLLGDSHGMHYAEGIYKVIAEPNKYNLYIAAGTSCFALPNFTRTTVGNDWDNLCKNALNRGLDFIKKGNYPIVVVSESWLFQFGVAGILDENGKRIDRKITIQDVKEGILNLKKLIGNSQLIVIGNVPGAGYNLYDIFSRPRPILFTEFNPEYYFYYKPKKENLDFNRELKNLSKDTNQFVFLDPHDVLCENNKCKNLDENNNLIYSDTSHLSKYGSIRVINGFKESLLELLNKRGN
ncbi:acyltransferase family protein [Aliarcobacter butzleri]|uniref:acyltransferase family protein n=1 Tax=Aliarcobacter butzleri TaxID=28197 RepID=UPI003AD92CAF